jgi:hypothetical protein
MGRHTKKMGYTKKDPVGAITPVKLLISFIAFRKLGNGCPETKLRYRLRKMQNNFLI